MTTMPTEERDEGRGAATEHDGWVTTRIGARGYRVDMSSRSHALVLDQPEKSGGSDAGPTPYELILAALGSCIAMTLRFYALRRQWPLEGAVVRLRTSRSYAEDCEKCESSEVGLQTIERDIALEGALTEEQRQRLLQIADRCPIKQTLERGIRVVPAA